MKIPINFRNDVQMFIDTSNTPYKVHYGLFNARGELVKDLGQITIKVVQK